MGIDTSREIRRFEPPPTPSGLPHTEEERAAVREQLDRILSSSCFRNSRKYPAFLRYIVERTLDGKSEHLKERTLGVEVFGRDPEYDTSADPVVRIVAAEVRKKIGQYYHELAGPGEIVLDLHPGGYVPTFGISTRTSESHPAVDPAAPEPPIELPALEPASIPAGVVDPSLVAQPARRLRFRQVNRWAWYATAALSLIVLIGGAASLTRSRDTDIDRFWGPVMDAPGSVLLVVGGGASWLPSSSGTPPVSETSPPPLSIDVQESRDVLAVSDVSALAAVSGILRSSHRSYLIRPSTVVDLAQLRTQSAVLIGAFNNSWTLRLTAPLRFDFVQDLATKTKWIQDRKNPGMRGWSIVTTTPYRLVTDDWAVISRFRDPETEHWIVTVAGVSRWGTIAAGEFLTNPVYLKELARLAPASWARNNLQAVIATKVIDGQPGPPRILATEFW